MEMAETKIRYALGTFLLAALLLCGAEGPASAERKPLNYAWGRFLMDGHRTIEGLSPGGRKVQKIIDSCEEGMAEYARVVGYSPEAMRSHAPESPLSNWYADLLMSQCERITGQKVDLSLANFGGVRVAMPKGEVTVDDIRSMFPFKNYITLVRMRGDKLEELFRWMASSQWQIVGGVHIEADASGLKKVEVGGQPIDPSGIYNIATINFLLRGGDGFYLERDAVSVTVTQVDQFTAVMNHLEELSSKGEPISASCDGRITVLDAPAPSASSSRGPLQRIPEELSRKGRLTILHTNDTHSHIKAIKAGKYAGMAGLAERAAFIDSVRLADGRRNVLVLDAGDFCQGTTYFSVFGGRPEVEGLNALGYDAVTVGNHEWDNGIDALPDLLKKARFPVVLCNYKVDNPRLDKLLRPYTIIRRGGLKIGITGVLVDVTAAVESSIASRLHYLDPVESINSAAAQLRRKGCDLVIVLSHCGYTAKVGEPAGDLQIAPSLKGVDIIIGGHTHTDLQEPTLVKGADGGDIIIATDFCWGIYVGELKLFK